MNGTGRASRQKHKADSSEKRVRRLTGENATSDEISRDSVAAHALATFGSLEKAEHWMNRPNLLFQGKTPAQLIESDLVQVEAELVRIDHGVYM
jgi:uncharacterized protein (DUF2384 family)